MQSFSSIIFHLKDLIKVRWTKNMCLGDLFSFYNSLAFAVQNIFGLTSYKQEFVLLRCQMFKQKFYRMWPVHGTYMHFKLFVGFLNFDWSTCISRNNTSQNFWEVLHQTASKAKTQNLTRGGSPMLHHIYIIRISSGLRWLLLCNLCILSFSFLVLFILFVKSCL